MATSRRILTSGVPLPAKEFLIPNPVSGLNSAGKARQRDEQKNIFLAFAHDYFGLPSTVAIVGLQCAYGHSSGDQFVALEDSGGGSFCLPVNLLMESAESARAFAAAKLEKFRQTFAKEIQHQAG